MRREYTYKELREAYGLLGIVEGQTVVVKSDLRFLGPYKMTDGAPSLVEAHFHALADLINLHKGTLVMTTASTSLCNTQTIFDTRTTPSEMGALTEYHRLQSGAERSFHPFLSYTAIGAEAVPICRDASRHGFGPETPPARLLERDTLFVSIGQPARLTASIVHHAEMQMGVPYRYVKEFIHPVRRENSVQDEPFYMHVWYRECDNHHDGVQKIFEAYINDGGKHFAIPLGRGYIYSMPLKDYYHSAVISLKKNIYAFLISPPKEKPYRK